MKKIKNIIDILDLADHSNNFASFLTIGRKYGCHCVCIFHIILPEREVSKKN